MEAKNNHKRILSIAASVSMILLSTSAFLLSVNRTFAEPTSNNIKINGMKQIGVVSGCEVYPFGIVNGKAYWIEYNSSGWHFQNSDINTWKSE